MGISEASNTKKKMTNLSDIKKYTDRINRAVFLTSSGFILLFIGGLRNVVIIIREDIKESDQMWEFIMNDIQIHNGGDVMGLKDNIIIIILIKIEINIMERGRTRDAINKNISFISGFSP